MKVHAQEIVSKVGERVHDIESDKIGLSQHSKNQAKVSKKYLHMMRNEQYVTS